MNAFSPEKILVHYDKLKNPENTYPITFTIDPTNYCNHDCDFCLNGSQRKQFTKELPLETIKDILELSKKIGVKGIKIAGGGEPLMYSKINDLLDLLACYDLDYALVTNGSLLFKIDIEKLKIFKYINVSAETFNPDAYKSIRKVDSTKQLLLGIKKFNTFNLKTKLNLSCLLHDNSTPYLYETIESAKILGFNSVKIKNLANTDSHITIQKNNIQSLNSRDFVVSINDSKFEFTYNRCQAVYLGGVWAADGKFHICCDRRNDKLYLFDFINDGVHKFQEYWQSDKHRELVNSIRPKTDCPNCSYDYYNRVIFDLQKNDLFENLL